MILLTNEGHRKHKKYVIFQGKNLKKNTLMMKNIVKLEVIVIIHVNKDVLHIAYVIQNKVHLKKLLQLSHWFKL